MGAAVPGLAAALVRELNVPTFVQIDATGDPHSPARMPRTDLESVTLAWLNRTRQPIGDLALQQRELALRVSTARIRRGLWAGAAAALLLILLDAGRLASHITHTRVAAQSASAIVHPVDAADRHPLLARIASDPDAILAAIESARLFRAEVERETQRRVDFRACMHELSRITPATVRFTNVHFQPTAANPGERERIGATIAGVVRPGVDAPARSELERFVLQLRASPLFDDVALANVHVESEGSLDQRFEVRFAAMPAPAAARAPGTQSTVANDLEIASRGIAGVPQGGDE